MTSWVTRASTGEPRVRAPYEDGSRRIRPMENIVRVEELLAAFWLAITELTSARNTRTKPTVPHACRANRFCHGLPSPALTKSVIRAGPNETVLAYVFSR